MTTLALLAAVFAPPAPPASLAPTAAPAPRGSAAPVASTAGATPDPLDWNAFVAARLAAARKGEREVVRLPLVERSIGWGCSCPSHYVGNSPDTGQGPWLSVVWPATGKPAVGEHGAAWVAEGVFSGKEVTQDLRDGKDGPAEYVYKTAELEVLRTRPHRGRVEDDRALVVLTGAEARKVVPPLADGKPWLVVVESVPLFDKATDKKAAAVQARLVAKGFAAAEIIDSRAAPNLFCCYAVILAGRFATEPEATALARDAKKRGFAPYVRKGF